LVAIKILPRKHMTNPQFVQRFYAEGKAAAKLNHPNIVGALDVGKAGDLHYFVMEFVEGHTVHDDILKHKRFPEKESLDIVIQVARALEHSHKAGFIHRDVKPKNIMITPGGQAKLADMGLARAVSDREAAESEAGKAFGTPYYISPEQIRGEVDVDFRCDIYGLGATFYHMVTGQVPFDGPNPSSVMHKHLKAELVPPDHINPTLSAGIGEIIEVCMAKDRNKRYDSTTSLLQDLEAVARGEPPLQARRRFDLAALSAMEKDSPAANNETAVLTTRSAAALTSQPVFWLAIAGWVVVLILLIVVLSMAAG
jgi:eukaryotic-like serine/threonine-protein kinase